MVKKPQPSAAHFLFGFAVLIGALALASGSTSLAARSPRGRETAPKSDGRDGKTGPVLIVLMLGNDEPLRERDNRFVTALELALDGFVIKRIETGVDDFPLLSLPQRLERIRPFVEEFDAVAATWIEETGGQTTLLHLVALSTGRALVRIVETPSGPEAETELAMAAQELLGEAYLFVDKPADEAMERVVTQVQKVVLGSGDAAKLSHERGMRLGAVSLFEISGGLYGHEDPYLLFGGTAGLEIGLTSNLFLRGGISFWGHQRERPGAGIVTGWGLEPKLMAGYDLKLDQFSVGPLIGVAARRSVFDMRIGRGDNQVFSWWGFRGLVGADLKLRVKRGFSILAEPIFGIWPSQKEFTRLSDGAVIFTTPFVDWSVLIGFVFFI